MEGKERKRKNLKKQNLYLCDGEVLDTFDYSVYLHLIFLQLV